MRGTRAVPEWRTYLGLIAPASDYTQVEVVARVLALGRPDVHLDQTTVSNWRRGAYSPPRAPIVAAVAEAFGREPVEALVAAGLLDINWVTAPISASALRTLEQVGISPRVGAS